LFLREASTEAVEVRFLKDKLDVGVPGGLKGVSVNLQSSKPWLILKKCISTRT